MTETHRVAVLGGTFDPVHNGHLALAVLARDAIGAREAWLVPARMPAMREAPVAPAELRQAMLEAAVRPLRGVRVEDVEIRRAGVSYTIDTVAELQARRPAIEPWWILGSDAVRHIGAWHRSDELRSLLHLVVVQRAGHPRFGDVDARDLGLVAARTIVLDVAPPHVSASEVRRRVAHGEPIGTLVPAAVSDIIAASGLYRPVPAVRQWQSG